MRLYEKCRRGEALLIACSDVPTLRAMPVAVSYRSASLKLGAVELLLSQAATCFAGPTEEATFQTQTGKLHLLITLALPCVCVVVVLGAVCGLGAASVRAARARGARKVERCMVVVVFCSVY